MKVAIYSPYLDTFGGGEKYMMTIAEVLSSDNEVEILLDKHLLGLGADYLKQELSQRFDLNLKKTNFIKSPLGAGSNILDRTFFLRKYDLLFYLTDGSIFYPTAGKNVLHIQSPLVGQPAKSVWGKLKLKGWNLIIYNSNFTKINAERNWPTKSMVIYPPVDVEKIKPKNKKKYILSVGRFFGYLKDKKQDILIKTFRELYEEGKTNEWSLHLAGAASEGDQAYLKDLKKSAQGLPIFFYPNINHDKLIRLYGESSIYWHASGFKEDDPAKMEHFGISTVEAMAAGCVPIVINRGGQAETVQDGKNGLLWNSLEDMKKLTVSLISDQLLMNKLSKGCRLTSQRFSKAKFEKEIIKLVKMDNEFI
ncbi:MAG: glycosyltransferase family 4 protein [Candidatus Daviesbacteria bacterium]|nr:glycosyltransferase family 4 protein [Candidatus Daviesbacteria bacterium]